MAAVDPAPAPVAGADSGSSLPQALLVVLDGTAECRKALRFAALRALHTGTRVKLLHVIKPTGFVQWGGVQKTMEAEVEADARAVLAAAAAEAEAILGTQPETILRRGRITDEVTRLVREDGGIRGLVLAAAAAGRPGPLVDHFSGEAAGRLPCIVMIVPGGISDEALDRLS